MKEYLIENYARGKTWPDKLILLLSVWAMLAMSWPPRSDLIPGLVRNGVIAGVLAARFHRWVIILVTGVSGGWRAASLLGRAVPSMTAQTVLIVAGALAAAGIIFQFVTTRKLAK